MDFLQNTQYNGAILKRRMETVMRQLCLGTHKDFERPVPEQIRLIGQAGFDGFFTAWDGDLMEYRRTADREGLFYQSVHAPYHGTGAMWRPGEEGEAALEQLLGCLRDCSEAEVPVMVSHTYYGDLTKARPNRLGMDRYGFLTEQAKGLGVKLAFENTEAEDCLRALLEAFPGKQVGFCWDSGHEQCYSRGKDLLKCFGNRLIATHLNDNLGARHADFITPRDDLHLLPYDGIIDWTQAMDKLRSHGYSGPLTFELKTHSKPNQHENDPYRAISLEDYLREAFTRAIRVSQCL